MWTDHSHRPGMRPEKESIMKYLLEILAQAEDVRTTSADLRHACREQLAAWTQITRYASHWGPAPEDFPEIVARIRTLRPSPAEEAAYAASFQEART